MESSSDSHLDIDIINRIAEFKGSEIEETVFRVVAAGVDATAFSTNGGRWAPPSNIAEVPVLYTSLEREGAIAEVVSYLQLLSPPPSKPMELNRLEISAKNVLTLSHTDLAALGLMPAQIRERPYVSIGQSPASLSQKIGSAANFLGFDGLIVPSARWQCNNLVLYEKNHDLGSRLEVLEKHPFDWAEWAERNPLG
jgi:RES domain-containing protein